MVKALWAIALFGLPLAAQQARAQGWEFELVPYLWVAGIDGDVSASRDIYDGPLMFRLPGSQLRQ